jgi:hypothetical protein
MAEGGMQKGDRDGGLISFRFALFCESQFA